MTQVNNSIDFRHFLSDDGPLARSYANFETRSEQIDMALAVQSALSDKHHLAIEAGTGVGKSFAYLLAAAEAALKQEAKILISTFTITLQQQLLNKDIPMLQKCLDHNFVAILAKGRGNYLCRRRLNFAIRRQRGLIDSTWSKLMDISHWSNVTQDGSLSDIPLTPSSKLWDSIKSEHGNCRGRNCSHYKDCFYWINRRKLETADIIIANDALMFSDLVLKAQGGAVLPEYKYVIIDEAHNIESVAENHFGIDINNHRIRYLLNNLYDTRTHLGLLAYQDAPETIDLVKNLSKQSQKFFADITDWYQHTGMRNRGKCESHFIENSLVTELKTLRSHLIKLAKATEEDDIDFELRRFADQTSDLILDLDTFFDQNLPDHIYWVEVSPAAKGTIRLKSASVNIGVDINRALFETFDSVIVTSATLSCGSDDKNSFGFFANRIGLKDFRSVKLGSPYDYEKNVTIYIEKSLSDPNSPNFIEDSCKVIKKHLAKSMGKTFILFTSYKMLNSMADELGPWLADNKIQLLQQGSGISRWQLLDDFRDGKNCVLFGTDSFWQGVDIPGDSLSCVIIVRLPFAVPDQPLLSGKLDLIRAEGGNPFFDYQLPTAIIKFKQGFGRLIRSKSDSGTVVILDSRIVTKRYGRRFLTALPKCNIELT